MYSINQVLSNLDNYPSERPIILVSLIAVIQFIIITLLAGFFYPGKYSIVGNYFSDLGSVRVNNQLNPIASLMFMIAIFLIAFGLLPYWILLAKYFSATKIENILSTTGSILGIISSFSLVLVALNPVDTKLDIHVYFAGIFFFCFGLFILTYSINFFINKRVTIVLFYLGFVLFIFSLIFISGIPRVDGYGPFWEKLTGYMYFIWILILDLCLLKKSKC